MKKFAASLLFGNYFYGICAVGLAIESSLQFQIALNDPPFYLAMFSATVLYYTFSYMGGRRFFALLSGGGTIPCPAQANERSLWYYRNLRTVRGSIRACLLLLLASGLAAAGVVLPGIRELGTPELLLLGSAPLLAVAYSGLGRRRGKTLSLRRSGWIKPFVIGMVWAMVVTLYPLWYQHWSGGAAVRLSGWVLWLLLKNWMFISVLCILFDIKDYADDANRQLKTFVVRAGLRKTLFYIILPLTILGLAAFWVYALQNEFSTPRILINTLPFAGLILATYSLHQRRPIYYYLLVIDGLMLVKAACGSFAALYFS